MAVGCEIEQPSVLGEKLSKLKQILQKIQIVKQRIEYGNTQRKTLWVKILANKWFLKTFKRDLSSYDVLGCSKHRTMSAGCVEELMRILCELDQVQSEGLEQIRDERRKLVKSINCDILPKADELLMKAEKLLSFFDKHAIKPKVEAPIQNTEAMETETDVEMETDEVDQVVEEDDQKDDEEEDDEEDSDDNLHENDEKQKQEQNSCVREETEREHPVKPKYKIEDAGRSIVIQVGLPKNESARTLRMGLEDRNTFVVEGNTFRLPFDVNPNLFSITEATYQFLSKSILQISIPKQIQRRTGPRTRMSPFGNHYRYPGQRPTAWAW